MYLLVGLLSEGGACGTEVAGFSAAETKLLFDASFAFFWGQLGDLDCVYDHSVGVVGFGGGGVGVITYECRLLPARIEGWCQGQGVLLPRCPSEKVQRGNQWVRVLAVLARTSEGFE